MIEWEAHARYTGGAAPSTYIQAQANKLENGVARVDLETGKVEMLPAKRRVGVEMPLALQQAVIFSYQMGASDIWETEPWEVNGQLAAITGEIAGELQVLQLQRWNPATGKVERPVALAHGQALVSYVSPDGHYLFIHSELPADNVVAGGGTWWLFSVATGEQLAVLAHEQGAREACVLDSCVYYIVENPPPAFSGGGEIIQSTLKAIDIASSKPVWQRILSPRRVKVRPALRQ